MTEFYKIWGLDRMVGYRYMWVCYIGAVDPVGVLMNRTKSMLNAHCAYFGLVNINKQQSLVIETHIGQCC